MSFYIVRFDVLIIHIIILTQILTVNHEGIGCFDYYNVSDYSSHVNDETCVNNRACV